MQKERKKMLWSQMRNLKSKICNSKFAIWNLPFDIKEKFWICFFKQFRTVFLCLSVFMRNLWHSFLCRQSTIEWLKYWSDWVIGFFAFFWICTYTWEYKLRDRLQVSRSSHPKVFLGKGVLKLCNKFSAEHPYRSVISIKLLGNFIEITLWHGRFLVNLLPIFRTPFPNNTSGWLLLKFPFLY